MKETESQIIIEKDDVICHDGDISFGLYRVLKGELLICKRHNHRITPIAYLEAGDYFGELSFFDKSTRSADVVALQQTTLIRIADNEDKLQLPKWLKTISVNMTRKLRFINATLSERGIKRTDKELKPLSMDEQRRIYSLLVR